MEKGRIPLEEFLEKFPPSDYIQVLPSLILKDSLPSYLSFAVEVVRVDPDDDRQTYKPPGAKGKALSGAVWETIGTALGLKWVPDLCRRMDDGRDRKYCHFQSGAVLSNLTGMVPIVCNYDFNIEIYRDQEKLRLEKYPPDWSTWKISAVRPDLLQGGREDRNARFQELSPDLQEKFLDIKVRENVLTKEQFLLRLCESGSRLRVIRKITGLPHVFNPEVLKKKAFAILKVIIRIQPETEAERAALNARLIDRMYPAYGLPAPSGGPAEIGSGTSPPLALGAGTDQEGAPDPREAEYEEIEIGPGEEGPEAAREIESSPPSDESLLPHDMPVGANPVPDFIRDVGEYGSELRDLIGREETKKYVGILLSERNYKKLQEVTEAEKFGFLSDLKGRLDDEVKKVNETAEPAHSPGGSEKTAESLPAETNQHPPEKGAPDAPFWAGTNYASIMDITARRVSGLSDSDLREGISRLIDDHKYDTDKDPIALSAIMGVRHNKDPRAGLEEGYMRLIEYGILHARRG